MSLLTMSGIVKRFGAIEAVGGVDFHIEPGEVVGLMGDNGAGKSTLVKMISGNFPPDGGEMRLEDHVVHFHRPSESRARGIEVVYQDLALCDNLTASDNVFLAREERKWLAGFIQVLKYGVMRRRSRALFDELKSETRASDPVKRMSGGQRQAVAIARTRLIDAKLILMDEPTAAISVRQVHEVLELIKRLRDSGIAIILISHRMPDVFAVCDRIVVMRRGRVVADKPIKDSSPEEVTGLITGAIEHA